MEEDGIFEWQRRAVATYLQHLCPASGWNPTSVHMQVRFPGKEQPATRLMRGRCAGLVAYMPHMQPAAGQKLPGSLSQHQRAISLLSVNLQSLAARLPTARCNSAFWRGPALRPAATWRIPSRTGRTQCLPHALRLIHSPSQKNAGSKDPE